MGSCLYEFLMDFYLVTVSKAYRDLHANFIDIPHEYIFRLNQVTMSIRPKRSEAVNRVGKTSFKRLIGHFQNVCTVISLIISSSPD